MPEPFTPTLAKSASLATLAGTTHTRKSVSFVQSSTARKARHPNQLDLFADTPIDRASAADSLTAPALATEHPDGRQYPPRADDSQPLAEAPAADGRGADPKESAVAGVAPGPGADGRSPLRTHLGEKDGLPGGVGTGDGRMGAARDRSPPEGAILCEPEPEPTLFPSRDFRITDTHRIGQGSLQQKARDNIAAIRALKKLEGENRDATGDEKAVLARYAGWGALSGVFDWHPSPEWKQVAKELKDLLTDEEYESARASTPNAHFTSPLVIAAMWDAMRHLGLPKDAHILEPAGARLEGNHGTELLAGGTVRRRNDNLAQELSHGLGVSSRAGRRLPGGLGRPRGLAGGSAIGGRLAVVAGGRDAGDDSHYQESAHHGNAGHQEHGPARAEAFLAAMAPPNHAAHT